MITNYIPNTCGYGLNNLKKVVHIFSESANVVHIDNGEAYVTNGITNFQTIKATSVSFEETVSYDDRFKFQKTVTATVNGFWKLSELGGKYYVVLEDENGVMWLVNADFPSLVTYTYTLQDGTDETVFTFSALSNFPTLKLNASVNNSYECKNYAISRVDELKMLEKRYANLNASSGIVYGYSNQVYKTVKFNEGSFKLEESFDGVDASTTIQFDIDFDDYQSSWHYNILEYPYNKYVAVIDHLACGFEMGLVPSYNVQGSHQIGGGDTVTVTLVGGSQRGSEWAESWMEVTVAPVYTWRLSDEWVCQPTECKYKLILSDSRTVTGECDSTSAITSGEVSSQYSDTVVSVEIGDCVTSIGDSAFEGCRGITSIEIPSGVTSIGSWAFGSCKSLTSIDIPSGVTSISGNLLRGCTSLTSVSITNNVTSIGGSALRACTSLTNITIPDSVTTINSRAFQECSGLTSITIPSGVTEIGYGAFYGCSGLTSITVSAMTPPTLGGVVFNNTNNCPIYVPCESVNAYKTATNWDNYADRIQCVEPVGEKFRLTLSDSSTVTGGCDSSSSITYSDVSEYFSNIVSVEIGDCVTKIANNAFQYCTSLQSVSVSDSVTSIGGGAFHDCSGLVSVNMGNGVENIDSQAFDYCVNLTGITIPDSVTEIGELAFYSCCTMTNVTFGSGIERIYGEAFSDCKSITSITIPSSVKRIDNNAFDGCSGLTRITSLREQPPVGGYQMFDNTNNCPIYVPCASVDIYKAANGWSDYADRIQCIPTPIQYRWVAVSGSYECSGTTKMTQEKKQQSIDGSHWTDVSPAETRAALPVIEYNSQDCGYVPPTPTIDGKFQLTLNDSSTVTAACDSTSAITNGEVATQYSGTVVSAEIGDCVTTIGGYAFSGCSNLTSVTIPNSVTSIEYGTFRNCRSLTSVVIPDSVTSIGMYPFEYCTSLTSVTIGSGVTRFYMSTFSNCSGLTSVVIPDSLTSLGNDAFARCSSLTSVTIGSGVTKIDAFDFAYCTSLSSITIPNSVTVLDDCALRGCTSLANFTIPSGITYIGDMMLYDCTSLTAITVVPTTPPTMCMTNKGQFDNTNNCPIYVPAASVDTYKAASGWSDYADRIQPIPT